jgi:NADH dehydrogenase
MEYSTKQIVLIGGGYASIWAYRSIVNELLIEMMMGKVQIKVICPEEFHFFHGWTAESLVGIIRDENRMTPLAKVFEYAELIKGKAVQIDSKSRIVYVNMNNGSKWAVPYDHLLLGMGSTDTASVEGLAENAYQLKSHSAYMKTKLRIQFLIRKAAGTDFITAQHMLRFVIAGSGFTGVEIAANLAELIDVFKKKYPALRDIKPTINLINSGDELLPGLPSGLRQMKLYAEKILHQYGIKILHQTKIIRITNQGAHLSDGSFIESEMVISTIGQSRILLDGTQNLDHDAEKRIMTNTFLQINHHSDIWGAGDSVHITHSKTKKACPSNALWAIRQGEHAGKNIAKAILSHSLKPFTYKGLGQCASLGIGKGIGELYGIQFTGWPAWIMRWFFFQYFMPSKKVMWSEITDWIHLFFTRKRKDIHMCRRPVSKSFSSDWFRSVSKQPVYQN